ncbi:MAG: DUF6054 family protein [Nocardioides sp.]
MAHYARALTGDVDRFVAHLDRAVPGSSITAQAEAAVDQSIGDARMAVRVYERYSAFGGNRVSLSVSVLAVGTEMRVSAVTSGGSSAMFWKVNTWGEETFLEKAVAAIESFAG